MYKDLLITNDYEVFVEEKEGLPFIHCTVYNWTPSVYKRLKKDWEQAVKSLDSDTVSAVFSAIKEGDKNSLKFQKLFGMKEASRENGVVLFYRETF